jgi:dolichyl-phosphate-mannose-protein mannosyltransferase
MTESVRRRLVVVAALILAFRLWLSAALPITGDEAYFIYWGAAPDLGFYDHPPMVGWLLALLLRASAEPWVLRLASTLLPTALAAGIFLALRRRDEERAAWAAFAFLLLPVSVWNVLITTDIPLVFFSFASALCFRAALERRSLAWYAAAGALLGAAFLSKYFAVLLGLAYVVHVLATPRAERDWRGLAVTVACALPFAGVNLYWNYEHCWANLMFNVYNRHGDAGWAWWRPALYAAVLLYLLSPPAVAQLARGRARAAWLADRDFRFFAVLVALPLAVFAALAPVKTIGLHWPLSFVPFFFIAAGLALSASQLRVSVAWLGAFSALHVAAFAVAAALPLETWQRARVYDGLVYNLRTDAILRRLEPYAGGYRFAADGYSPAVVASYYAGLKAAREKGSEPAAALREHYFFVFGKASSHARHDDILTDFRALDGADIAVLRKNAPSADEYRPFFRSVEFASFTEAGATFHLVLGRGFDYATYRERVLAPVRDSYYAIPRYLPQGRCYFCERYFGASACPAR